MIPWKENLHLISKLNTQIKHYPVWSHPEFLYEMIAYLCWARSTLADKEQWVEPQIIRLTDPNIPHFE